MIEPIRFSRSLYHGRAVEQAVEAFDALGTFIVDMQDDAIVVTISDPDPDVEDVLVDELCNHALARTVAIVRSGDKHDGPPAGRA